MELDCSDAMTQPMQRRNQPQEIISQQDCQLATAKVVSSIESRIDASIQNFMRSILKFASIVQQMPLSKLNSCFHTFGATGVRNLRVTNTYIVKRAKRGKIHVQPEAAKRRKEKSGN